MAPTDPEYQALCSRLLPDVAAVANTALAAWRPEIHDPDLRAGILGNPRLTAHILAELTDPRPMERVDETQCRHLAVLLDADLAQLIQRIGLAWHAALLREPATVAALLKAAPDITRDDMRFALAIGTSRAAGTASEAELTAAFMQEQGKLCLQAWLGQLSEPLLRLLERSNHPLAAYLGSNSMAESEMAAVCAACLDAAGDMQ